MENTEVNFMAVKAAQYYVIFCAGGISCLLSIFGSLSIIKLVYKTATKPSAIFDRIMMGVCVADLLTTTANFLQPFMLPEYTRLPFAAGNQSTCRSLGFFFYVFLTSSVYSAELSFFFWVSVQRGRAIRNKNSEVWMHVIPWLIAIVTSVIALCLNILNPSPVLGLCMIACTIDPTTWECTSSDWWLTALSVTTSATSLMAAATGILFLKRLHKKVKEQEQRNAQYVFSDHLSQRGDNIASPETRRMKSTYTQALFYALAFLNSFVAVFVAAVGNEVFYKALGIRSPLLYFIIELYVYAMFPLQGFLNWIVFVRPRVLRWKEACQDRSLIWCLLQTVLGRPPPTTDHTTQHFQSQADVPNDKNAYGTDRVVQTSAESAWGSQE